MSKVNAFMVETLFHNQHQAERLAEQLTGMGYPAWVRNVNPEEASEYVSADFSDTREMP